MERGRRVDAPRGSFSGQPGVSARKGRPLAGTRPDSVMRTYALKERKQGRWPVLPPTALLFVLLALRAIPSDPAVPSPSQRLPILGRQLTSPQVAFLMTGGSLSTFGTSVVTSRDLSTALGGPARHFGLFRPESAIDGRVELLRGVPYGALLAAAGERHRVDSLLL